MPRKLKTPGVYIEEKNAFPSSAVAVETAVPVFIGYTEKAEWNSKSLIEKPTRITSFAEYVERFGGGFQTKFTIIDADSTLKQETFVLNGKHKVVKINDNHTFYLFNSIRLFYANGGASCYILAIDTYKDKKDGLEMNPADFIGSDTKTDPFKLLEKEFEPTLVLIPDAIHLGDACYDIYAAKVLAHCAKVQSRFGIFDLIKQLPSDTTDGIVDAFRLKIGGNDLKYGAAYYPWLKTSIVQPSEVTFENLDHSVDLSIVLPPTEVAAIGVVTAFKINKEPSENDKLNYHQALKATSPTYNNILEEVRSKLNELPASGAMAGLYTAIDSSRGVWKSPANVSVSMVNAPTINISQEQQEVLNIDVLTGKSINAIRAFPGIGTLVWGGRTLDGNSQDWCYINVRRTLIMIEQSLKLAAHAYVFEPNDANTWITVKSMISNFLVNLWKQGALAGASPEQAFDVQIGLGSTMTPNDILDGKMLITVKVAIVRPAEFIIMTFQQQMQQS
ncbi:MAG: phage tail sheath C-terminal domain-containing protein [Flavobacterium sp.]